MTSPIDRSDERATVLQAIRTNPLALWPDAAYDEMTAEKSFAGRRMLLVNAPSMIRHVLIARADIYRRTPTATRLLRPMVGRGLLLSEGALWQRQRRLITPTLAPRAIPNLMRPAVLAIGQWLDTLNADAPTDLLHALQGLALEIAARSMFSMSAAAFAVDIRALIGGRSIIALSRPDALDMMVPAGIPVPRDAARWWFKRQWMGLISRIIAVRQAEPATAEPRDLFDLLRAASDVHGAGGARQLRDETATMIVAGHETTALTLFWACVLVADDEAVQRRIAEEAAVIPLESGGDPCAPEGALAGAAMSAALDRLVFTRAVVSEALRLYPPAAMITRRATVGDQCEDVAVARHTTVVVAPWVLHRHRRFWSDPERFEPARFMPGAPPIDRFAYLPFGAGPRVCVGASFAMAETTLALAALLRRFVVTRADHDAIMPVVVLTTHPSRSPLFRLVPRH